MFLGDFISDPFSDSEPLPVLHLLPPPGHNREDGDGGELGDGGAGGQDQTLHSPTSPPTTEHHRNIRHTSYWSFCCHW